MTANNNLSSPATLVFSSSSKLASVTSGLGLEEFKGSLFETLFTPISVFQELLSENSSLPEELYFKPAEGYFPYLHHIMKDNFNTPVAVILVLLPQPKISEERPIDEKIIQMDRLAKAGQLASSIAHEIRNPLAGISANVQVLADIIPDKESYQKFFTIILDEINRVEKIIKDLLDYARPSKPLLSPVSLKNIFEHLHSLLSPQLTRQKIKLDIPITNENISLLGDFSQIIQVLLNCIMNSAHAMPEGGTIQLTYNEQPETITVSVNDQGIGIKKDLLAKIFEPFFTTRAKGLGLGLSVTKKIMEDHKGLIEIHSSEGKGTEVVLTFQKTNCSSSQNQESALCQIQS